MPGLFDINEHLVFYRKYHFNETNVAIHLCCIPVILLSAISFSIGTILSEKYHYPTLGVVLAWVYGIYYILLDWQLGVPAFIFLAGYAHTQRLFYQHLDGVSFLSKSQYINLAIAAHVICWLAQFYGHAIYERRAPALFDNLLQAIVLAPFFVVYEIAFWLGYKLDVRRDMNNKAGKLRLEMIEKEKKKRS